MSHVSRLSVLLCAVGLALVVLTGTAAAVDEPADGQMIVELDADGDADVVFTEEFDLSDDEQRAVFEGVAEDEELRAEAASQFREGMQFVSEEANEGIDRELRVGEVTVETATDGDVGIVGYEFRWENIARLDGDRIVLSEPFSTYDSLDRELVVFAPEGGELTSVSPQPQRQGTDVASWPGLTEFGESFEVVATAPDVGDDPDPVSDTEQPQFSEESDPYGGAPAALGVSALLLAALLVGRKR